MSRARRIAVIGGGVAGLTAAHVLQRAADVTVYEAEPRLGGHAHTHELTDDAGRPVSVDSGFIVHNERTYPQLLRLFAELGVATQAAEMSMSVRCGGCGLQYAGARGLGGLFPTAGNARNPRYLYMLTEVLRFHRRARALLEQPGDDPGSAQRTLSEFLTDGRFGSYFRRHFATPLVSAVWSCSPELAGEYPARYLFRFLDNHGMLSVSGSPQWRTVVGGSARYVELAAKQLTATLTATPVRAVIRTGAGVQIVDDADQRQHFDAAVIATHPDQALALLATPTGPEREILGAIGYSANSTVLHTDASVLPGAARAVSSWNYFLPDCAASAAAVRVTYDMNRLQRLNTDTRYLVTLNDDGAVPAAAALARMTYHHPIFTPTSVAAQARLGELNDDTLAFAGAYHGWGFHEDGCRSGVQAAADLGVQW
jgi:predicted NAD/FAD-binding protein